jgi:hypothetical protein
MNDADLLTYLRSQRWAIEATIAQALVPQAAIIGIAVTDHLELVFDTLASSRKATNLRTHSRIALVIGGWNDSDPRTLQYEGVADFPLGEELERVKRVYLAAFPDGVARLSWPGITYVRVRPTWIRYSDFSAVPPIISERSFSI